MTRSLRIDARPAFQFYPHDWMTDQGLRLCPLSARGLWIDMLCIMFDSPERGVLIKQNGSKVEANELAKLSNTSEEDVKQNLSKLESEGVFSKRDDGTIYSRRMVRDWELHNKRADAGRKGGLKGGRPSKDKAKKPPSTSSSTSTSSSDKYCIANLCKQMAAKINWPGGVNAKIRECVEAGLREFGEDRLSAGIAQHGVYGMTPWDLLKAIRGPVAPRRPER